MRLVDDRFPVAAPAESKLLSDVRRLSEHARAVVIGVIGKLPVPVHIHLEIKVKGNPPLVLGTVTAPLRIRDDVSRLCPPLLIEGVLLCHRAEAFTDPHDDADLLALFHPPRSQLLKNRMAHGNVSHILHLLSCFFYFMRQESRPFQARLL